MHRRSSAAASATTVSYSRLLTRMIAAQQGAATDRQKAALRYGAVVSGRGVRGLRATTAGALAGSLSADPLGGESANHGCFG
jgi:hypothetical protein